MNIIESHFYPGKKLVDTDGHVYEVMSKPYSKWFRKKIDIKAGGKLFTVNFWSFAALWASLSN